MRMPWNKSKPEQLDLLIGLTPELNTTVPHVESDPGRLQPDEAPLVRPSDSLAVRAIEGLPLMTHIERLCEDADNPRTEFPDADIDELADDIRQHGILKAIVVHPADVEGRYRIHFGAKVIARIGANRE